MLPTPTAPSVWFQTQPYQLLYQRLLLCHLLVLRLSRLNAPCHGISCHICSCHGISCCLISCRSHSRCPDHVLSFHVCSRHVRPQTNKQTDRGLYVPAPLIENVRFCSFFESVHTVRGRFCDKSLAGLQWQFGVCVCVEPILEHRKPPDSSVKIIRERIGMCGSIANYRHQRTTQQASSSGGKQVERRFGPAIAPAALRMHHHRSCWGRPLPFEKTRLRLGVPPPMEPSA